MGTKGPRGTGAAVTAAAHFTERLGPLGASSKPMFGGHGLFADGVMFGMITPDGALALKGNDATRDRIEAEGAVRSGTMPYWRVPASVVDDDDGLLAWAREALSVARAARR
ncbi:TfoX/Sxy family protein [Rubrivirga sp. IMCC45206]|uniref:TfoX/Sxy family protein n=1 Tax=Rubrivirga sp. IMCC45206 TaxID=3391614 RepID=UPI00398FF1A2